MGRFIIEGLEPRLVLSAGLTFTPPTAVPVVNNQGQSPVLTTDNVKTILAQAISESAARNGASTQVAVVTDREGTVLGMLASNGSVSDGISEQLLFEATIRARTASFFESNGEAFTTRTARFIIQNHFPPGVNNTPGGPLYGVEFSDLVDSDILLASQTPGVSGDPGGVPLYINGVAVGGIGVAGDFHDIAATPQLIPVTQDAVISFDNHQYNANPKSKIYTGNEEADRDEAVALAGAKGFLPPASIRANNIFVAGLRLPFAAEPAAKGKPQFTFDQLTSNTGTSGATIYSFDPATFSFTMSASAGTIIQGTPEMETSVTTTPTVSDPSLLSATTAAQLLQLEGNGLFRDRANVVMSDTPGVPAVDTDGNPIPHTDPQDSDTVISSADPNGLQASDVINIIDQAVNQAKITRAGIRKPNGVNAEVHIIVVDLDGNVLGAYRMNDGTNFSYDIAVQKARTAAFFSDDTHAITTTAIGFMSQRYFPPGISGSKAATGPLYLLQNNLNEAITPITDPLQLQTPTPPGLADGITIFPGGVPLYKNGKLVGAIGVSGDGVQQDDLTAFGGSKGYAPPPNTRSDELGKADLENFILGRVQVIQNSINLGYNAVDKAKKSLDHTSSHLRLPYVNLPRNPHV